MPPLDDQSPAWWDQSATLLSQQTPKSRKQTLEPRVPAEDWETIYQHLTTRLNGLRNWRWTWWTHWRKLAETILPRRYHWFITANRMTRGGVINIAIVDGTPTQALYVCSSGLWTGLTSPSRPWFNLGIALSWVELDEDGKNWLKDTTRRIYQVLAQSNFYSTMAQAFQDVVCFGTAPVIVYENDEKGILCYLPCAGEYFLQVGSDFTVQTMYREFTLTVEQIVQQFKLENCPAVVQAAWAQAGAAWDREYVVMHAIEPNTPLPRRFDGGQVEVVDSKYTYREVYWLAGQGINAELGRAGYYERPFMVARWSKVSNDAYGRSPGMDALGDAQQLQQETRRKGEFIEKGVRPPMGADPVLQNQPASTIPGQITYMDSASGKKGFWPLFEVNAQWLAGLTADIEKVSARVKSYFFVEVFMAITNMAGVQPRNELELTKRDLERLQQLGPMINLFEEEFAGPAIQRVMEIMRRRRMLLPMPASLRQVPLKINYISILKLAQQSAQQVSIKDALQLGGEISEASIAAKLPNPLRVLNLDKLYRNYCELANIDPDDMFTEQEVLQHDQARDRTNQQAQMPQMGMAAVQAAQTLSQTPTGPGTALHAILGGRGGQGAPQQGVGQ